MAVRVVSALVFSVFLLFASSLPIPASTVSPASYPEWAHSHWVWLSSSVANQTSEMQLVKDYMEHGIAVGAVDIDSQWATGDNSFVWDTEVYPDPQGMIDYFHSLDVRVICWATSVVDTDSPNFEYGLQNNFYLNTSRNIDHSGLINWWHGTGAFIDYTNPDALDWWHSQMDNVLDMGLDGWKCDGTDPYAFELYPIDSFAGQITERDYANMYYGDFYNYTKSKNSNGLIMSRPVDSYDVVYWSFSPHYLMYSGWVGDQDPTFDGLQNALRNMFHSAWRNYANYGSDIGGYRSGNRTKELFIRWAQVGAFCPLMENGGNGEHRPWMFDDTNQTLAIYRRFVDIHYELLPYFLTAGTTAMETGVSVMYPQNHKTLLPPDNWAYLLWTDILVNPIVEDSTDVSVQFPRGDNWVDLWDTNIVYKGGSTSQLQYNLETFPVFIRQGAVLALDVTKDIGLHHGDEYSVDRLTVFIPWALEQGEQIVRRYEMPSQELSYTYDQTTSTFHFFGSQHERSLIIVLHNVIESPSKIVDEVIEANLPSLTLTDFNVSDNAWHYDVNNHMLRIRTSSVAGTSLTIENMKITQ